MNGDYGGMRFKLLGAVGLISGNQVFTTEGIRLRTLLAVLLIKARETVSKDQFIDELWSNDVPAGAENALQALVARLRKLLRQHFGGEPAGQMLVTRPGGYLLNVTPAEVDVTAFEQLVARSAAMLNQDPLRSRDLLTEALALWEGPALQGIRGGPVCRSAALQYEESWLTAMERKIEAEIASGNASQAISELKRMACLHPWRERLTEMLMLSLYRVGRQAEAVAAYNQVRVRLVEELGMEPSPLLQGRVRAILNQDPRLSDLAV